MEFKLLISCSKLTLRGTNHVRQLYDGGVHVIQVSVLEAFTLVHERHTHLATFVTVEVILFSKTWFKRTQPRAIEAD
jgi:hypothetical protein